MGRETVDEVVLALGEKMGMPGLKLDAMGACQLLFDQRWLVTLVHLPPLECFGLHCPVTAASEAAHLPASALQAMLRASFQGQGAGGATLCVGPDQRAYLQRLMPVAGPGVDHVQHALEQLLNHAEAWGERLARPEPAPMPAAAAQDAAWAMQRV